MHVLLADVDPCSRRALKSALEAEGIHVSEATSAIETIARMHEPVVPVDALVIVNDLPPVQGSSAASSHEHAFGVLSWMRMSFPTLPLFYVSDTVTPELERRAHLFGIQLLAGRGDEVWACIAACLAAAPVPLPAPKRNVLRQEEVSPATTI